MGPVGRAVAAFLAASTLAGCGTVSAHGRAYPRRGYGYGYGYDTFRIGADRGYDEGLRHGRRDAYRRAAYRFSDDRAYRRGDFGYRSSFGPRGEYARGFRAGYERGYREGYRSARRYDRYDGYGGHGYGRDRYYKDDPYDRY
jgi:hypothetical protein